MFHVCFVSVFVYLVVRFFAYHFSQMSQNLSAVFFRSSISKPKIDPSIFISFYFPLILLLFLTIRFFRFLFLFESIKLPLKNRLH